MKKTYEEIAKEVLQGKCGDGKIRKIRLKNYGYKYKKVQREVAKLKEKLDPSPDITTKIAKEVISDLWGKGFVRKMRLKMAGYDYNKIQSKVDELMTSYIDERTKLMKESIRIIDEILEMDKAQRRDVIEILSKNNIPFYEWMDEEQKG